MVHGAVLVLQRKKLKFRELETLAQGQRALSWRLLRPRFSKGSSDTSPPFGSGRGALHKSRRQKLPGIALTCELRTLGRPGRAWGQSTQQDSRSDGREELGAQTRIFATGGTSNSRPGVLNRRESRERRRGCQGCILGKDSDASPIPCPSP